MSDCGCNSNADVKKWLYEDENIDNHITRFYSPMKNNILTDLIQSRHNFINSNSLLNDELKQMKEQVVKISRSEFTMKLESLML